jgi:hypothetical protein
LAAVSGLSAQQAKTVRLPSLDGLRGTLTAGQLRELLARSGFAGPVTTEAVPLKSCKWPVPAAGKVCGINLDDSDEREYAPDIPVILYVWSYHPEDERGPIPSVIGLPLEQAITRLDEHRFTDVYVQFEEEKLRTTYRGCAAGHVCDTFPGRGEPWRKEPGSVHLFVATRHPGPMRTDRMPDLTGLSFQQARNKLDELGCRGLIKIYALECPQNSEPGLVCKQAPEPGHQLSLSHPAFSVGLSAGRSQGSPPPR